MTTIPTNNTLTSNGDFVQPRARSVGRSVSIEVSGTFGGATVTPGYVSSDTIPVFIIDTGDDGLPRPKSAPGRWITSAPAAGKVGVSVSGSSGTTAIIIKIIDLLPR